MESSSQTNWLCINLDERKDRLKEITQHLEDLEIPFQRFPAIKHENGALGCMTSHIACLQIAIDNNFPYVVIIEDDAEFLISRHEIEKYILEFLKTDSPCFVFGGTMIRRDSYNNLFSRGRNIQTTTCYVVKNYYMNKIKKIFQANHANLLNTGSHEFAIDVVWKILQEKDLWLVPKELKVIQQRPGYSDIQNDSVDYRSNFR